MCMRRPEPCRTFALRAATAALLALACTAAHGSTRERIRLAQADARPLVIALEQSIGEAEAYEAYARAQSDRSRADDRPMTMTQAKRAIAERAPRRSLKDNIRVCGTQNAAQSAERIDACSRVLEARQVNGKSAGVALALRGLAYLDRGDLPHAIADLDRAVSLAPDFAPAYQNRGNAWYAKGNYGRALTDYDEAIKLDPAVASAYINRATAKRELGLRDDAIADYQKAIDLGANRASPYVGRGQIYLAQRDYAHAIADFDRAIQHEATAANYLLRAQARSEAGEFDKALSDYAEATRIEPNNASALIAQGNAWRQRGEADRAIALYQKAVKLDDNAPQTYRYLAEGYAAKGDRARAIKEISRALKFAWRPDYIALRAQWRLADGDLKGAETEAGYLDKFQDNHPAALAVRGVIAARRKDYAQALTNLDAALKADDKLGYAYAERGMVYAAKSDTEHALPDLNRAIELRAAGTAAYRERAAIYKSKGELGKAIADIGEAIKRDPKAGPLLYERATWRLAAKDNDLALADFSEAIARGIDKADAYYQRATLRNAKGDRAGMLADLDDAIKRDPNKATYYRSRGAARLASKAYDKAAGDFGDAIRLEPGNAADYYQRGIAREQSGDLTNAAEDFQLALGRRQNYEDARKALSRVAVEIRRNKVKHAARERAGKHAAKSGKAGGDHEEAVAIAPIEQNDAKTETTGSIPIPAARPQAASSGKAERTASQQEERTNERASKGKTTGGKSTARASQRHDTRRQAERLRPVSRAERDRLARERYFQQLEAQRRNDRARQYDPRRRPAQFTDAFRDYRR